MSASRPRRPLVLLATCSALPNGDADDGVLVTALAEAGVDARWQVWDDPGADWAGGLTVLRSVWDYTPRREEFVSWVASLPAVANPAPVVRWNSDKRYLLDLADAGLPVTPTVVIEPGQPTAVPFAGEIVVKPSIGAGSRGAGRFSADERDRAATHVRLLHMAGRTALVQPYLPHVDEAGETAIVAFDGVIDHAARKGPMLRPGAAHDVAGESLFIEENITSRDASPQEREVAEAALSLVADRFGGPLLYARVDLLPSAGGPTILELEVVEPSLFFGCSAGSVHRYAAAVAERAGSVAADQGLSAQSMGPRP